MGGCRHRKGRERTHTSVREQEICELGLFGFVLSWNAASCCGGPRANVGRGGAAGGAARQIGRRELFADSRPIFEQWMHAFALLGACSGAAVSVRTCAGHCRPTLALHLCRG